MRDYPSQPKPSFKRAIFMDRDGTINVDTHYPHRAEDLELIPEAIEGIRILSKLPNQLIIITNQSGIALKLYEKADMTSFNQELVRQLESQQAHIDGIYYCPHHESINLDYDASFCTCSKPQPGLLLEAAADFQIDLANSFMIGDKTSDILAGKNAGCITILVRTGKAGLEEGAVDVTPDHTVDNLLEAAKLIKNLTVKTSQS